MSTSVRERPAEASPGDSGRPARRAVVRWAWRLFRREWRQQLLVLALLTFAVAVTVLGAAVATNTPSSPEAVFGTASYLVTLPGADPHLAADITAIRRRFGAIDVIENQAIATGSVSAVELRSQDPSGPYGQPVLGLLAGRYPTGPDQVAMTSGVASLFSLRIGDRWHRDGRARLVVGLVENPANLLDEFALVAPGQISRLRALGMLGALGATDRNVRLVMIANGAVVGVVGTLAGAAIGLAGWVAAAPELETIAEHRIDRLNLPWWVIATAMALAIVTAIAASWWPAGRRRGPDPGRGGAVRPASSPRARAPVCPARRHSPADRSRLPRVRR